MFQGHGVSFTEGDIGSISDMWLVHEIMYLKYLTMLGICECSINVIIIFYKTLVLFTVWKNKSIIYSRKKKQSLITEKNKSFDNHSNLIVLRLKVSQKYIRLEGKI